MYARVATFEGADTVQVRAAIDAISAAGRPPEGVESHSLTVFGASDSGRVVVVSRFATRDALDRAHAVLSAMEPPAGGFGKRVAVDLMDVLMDVDAATMSPAGG